MRRLWALAVGLTLIVGVRAGPDDPPKSPAEELKQLQKQVADAQKKAADLRKKVQEEEDADAKKKLQDESEAADADAKKLLRENQTKAVAIAKADPKSETGLDAAIWGMISLRAKPSELLELVSAIVENHAANKKISAVMPPLQMLANIPGEADQAFKLLETIAEKNPEKSVQASAIYSVADFYKNKSEPRGGKAPSADAEELAKKAELGFERLEKDYADVIQFRDRTYGALAKSTLFELRHLRVGKTAPEVEGEDVDGVKFKLTDYRGKVVMLDFWGHW